MCAGASSARRFASAAVSGSWSIAAPKPIAGIRAKDIEFAAGASMRTSYGFRHCSGTGLGVPASRNDTVCTIFVPCLTSTGNGFESGVQYVLKLPSVQLRWSSISNVSPVKRTSAIKPGYTSWRIPRMSMNG